MRRVHPAHWTSGTEGDANMCGITGIFDTRGRHVRTQDGLTGALRYQLSYNSAGRLMAVTDGDSNVTTIERDAHGNATAIVAPFGQRTALRLDANGYLTTVTNPAGESTALTSDGSGLLTALTTPRGTTHRFSYDAMGRLTRDTDPAGGFTVLARTDGITAFTATLTSALNRVSTYLVEQLSTGGTRRVDTDPAGLQTVTRIDADGTRTTIFPTGMVTTLVPGPDPRFGMQAPIRASVQTTTPGGLHATLTARREVTLDNLSDPLNLTSATNTVSVNGRPYTSTFDVASRQFTDTTPVGRQRRTTLDPQGRVVAEQVAGLEPRHFTYDTTGRLSSITQGPRTAILAYDAQGFLASLTDPLGRAARFAYDAAGRLTRQTLPDGREVLHGVVCHLAIEMRVDHVRDRGEKERVAIGQRLRSDLRREQPARSAAIVHDELLAKRLGEPMGGDPAQYVRRAAGRKADDQPHRAVGVRARSTGIR